MIHSWFQVSPLRKKNKERFCRNTLLSELSVSGKAPSRGASSSAGTATPRILQRGKFLCGAHLNTHMATLKNYIKHFSLPLLPLLQMLLGGWRGGGRDIPFTETTSQGKVLWMQQFVALEGPFRAPQERDKGLELNYKSSIKHDINNRH